MPNTLGRQSSGTVLCVLLHMIKFFALCRRKRRAAELLNVIDLLTESLGQHGLLVHPSFPGVIDVLGHPT